jgi:exosortase N
MLLKIYLTLYRISKYKVLLPFFVAGALYLLLGIIYLSDYLIIGLQVAFGLLLLPFIFVKRGDAKSIRYFWPALVCIVLSFFAPLKTLYFLSLLFAFLFLIESFIVKVNIAVSVLLILISPIFLYFSSFFGVPLRIELSILASQILSSIGYHAESLGNIIVLNGKEFSVDAGCMGLSMLGISLILGLFLIAFYERKSGKHLSILSVALLILSAVLLNLCSNLFRIIILVLFHIPPEDPLHEAVGLACFAAYIVIPELWLTKVFYKRWGKDPSPDKENSIRDSRRIGLHLILLSLLIFTGYKLKHRSHFMQGLLACNIQGYQKSQVNPEVLKFENSKALIYVKPVQSFYGAEHSPMICWTNNGYEFTKVNKEKILGIEVYTGILQKGEDKIYCSWWFDNGEEKTINQADWRWEVLSGGKNFCLVNVNAASEESLLKETSLLLKQNLFKL